MSGPGGHVLVVGGGAGGTITAATLLRAGAHVTVVERAAVVGPGLAYGTASADLLLNNYACRMSAVEEDPEHLVRWGRSHGVDATADTFLPRRLYGRYLVELLHELPAGSSLRRVRDEVVDLADAGSDYLVQTARGTVLAADLVVLALGTPPPRRPFGLTVDDARFVTDPWEPGLLERVHDGDSVLLLGTGLTTVDVAAQLAAARRVRLTAVSRHGLLPLRHLPEAPETTGLPVGPVGSLRGLLDTVRSSVQAGADWRLVVESVKAVGNDLWRGLSPADRAAFVRHACRYWEIARHRMAPAMAEVVDELLASGRLVVTTSASVDPASYDLVVNCTGPAPVSTAGWNPLVDSLAAKGLLCPGPLGLGVDIDAHGALLDAEGVAARGVYVVGAARRGAEWEVAAVPDIRRQALRLVQHLTDAPVQPRAAQLAG